MLRWRFPLSRLPRFRSVVIGFAAPPARLGSSMSGLRLAAASLAAVVLLSGCAARGPVAPDPGAPLPAPGRSPLADELVYGRLHPQLAFPARVRRWPARRLVLRVCDADLARLAAQLPALGGETFAPVAWYVRQMVRAARQMFADVLGPEAVVDLDYHQGPACPSGPLVVRVRFVGDDDHGVPRCAQTLLPAPDRRSIVIRADGASADRCLARAVFPPLFAHEFAHALGLYHTTLADGLMRSVVDAGRAPRLSPRERYWAQRVYAVGAAPPAAVPPLAVESRPAPATRTEPGPASRPVPRPAPP